VPLAIGEAMLLYTRFRVFDFIDIFEAKMGLGLGVFAGASVTRPLSVGLGYAESVRFGFDARKAGRFSRTEIGLPFTFIAAFVAGTHSRHAPPASSEIRPAALRRRPPIRERAGVPFARKFDVWVSATAGIPSARVGVHPGEALDFVLGLLTIDFARDDRAPRRKSVAPAMPVQRTTERPPAADLGDVAKRDTSWLDVRRRHTARGRAPSSR